MKTRPERTERNIVEDFTFIANNLIPTNLEQAEWICHQIDQLTQQYPKLQQKLIQHSTLSEKDKKEMETIIQKILAESEVQSRKTKNR